MLLRRGHRLHSVGGTSIDPSNLHRFEHKEGHICHRSIKSS